MLGHIRLVLHFTAAVSGHEANTVASKTIIKKTHTHHTNAPNRCERIAFPISPVTGALIVPFGNDPVAVERFMTFTGLRADRPSSRPKGLAGKGECVQKWRTVTRWLGCFFVCMYLRYCCAVSEAPVITVSNFGMHFVVFSRSCECLQTLPGAARQIELIFIFQTVMSKKEATSSRCSEI